MLVVGLTGNIGSGKTTVSQLLVARGVPVIDADVLAREAVTPGSPALAAIVARWGKDILAADGALNRAALRHIVFGDAAERAALEAIVHPAVKARRDAVLASARRYGEPVVVCDIPLLFETGLDVEMDVILFVDAPRTVRLERLVRDRGLPRAEAAAMIEAQMPAGRKRARSDYVIHNGGTLEELRARVDDVWRTIERDRLA